MGVFVGLPSGVVGRIDKSGARGNGFVGVGRTKPSFNHFENIAEKRGGGRIVLQRFEDTTIGNADWCGALVVVKDEIGKSGTGVDGADAVL